MNVWGRFFRYFICFQYYKVITVEANGQVPPVTVSPARVV
jgi:hypothetical protein